ncbi:hypothetical protein ABEB36_005512 [Hypothenemus hampei]|uniref:MIT domain-containing protein n=1 Tax=Hypothenemus hampei TaxID=57062 RepID=A0ABD1EYH0_HYPHA
MGNADSTMWSATYLSIKNKHDCAFKAIEGAITLEEQEKPREAIEKYKEGIRLIDEALRIQVQQPEHPDATWDKACTMIQKLKKTRAEVLTRINCVQTAPGSSTSSDEPPSYEEAMSSSGDESTEVEPVTYRDLATALQQLSVDPNQQINEELVYSHPGVRLYFISPSGQVLSTREPQLLKISLVQGDQPNTPRAILQIGTWIYPLVPGVSPCYRTDYGAFILPDVYSDIPGSSVGIILPSDADADVFELLESILHGIVTQETEKEIYDEKRKRKNEPLPVEDTSERMSRKIVNGAWTLSQGIIKGAIKAGELLNRGTPKLIDSLAPAEQPVEVSESVIKGVKIAETATSKAVQVTGFVAEKVGEGTVRLGQFLAPHIQKQGTKLLASGFHMSERDASEKMKSVLTIAAGAVEGFSTVYRGLETSAGILGRNLKDNTVKVVEHKWGPHCATATESSLSTVGNVYSTYENAKILKPKGLIKSTAKGAVHNSKAHGPKRMYPEIPNQLQAGPSFQARHYPVEKIEKPPRKRSNQGESIKKSDDDDSEDEKPIKK